MAQKQASWTVHGARTTILFPEMKQLQNIQNATFGEKTKTF